MGENAYSSIGEPMDRAWVDTALDQMLSGTERPNVYFLPTDDPLWGLSSGEEDAQAMYYGPSITEKNPTWDLGELSTIRAMGGIETTNNLFLPKDQEVSENSIGFFGHELMHYLDDTMAEDVPSEGFESYFPFISDANISEKNWALGQDVDRKTIPTTAFQSAESLAQEWTDKPTEALSYYTEKKRGHYPEIMTRATARKILEDKAPEDVNILDISAYTQDVGDVRNLARFIASQKLTDYGKGQYYFDPKGKGYDYARAHKLGYTRSDDPSGKDHLPSLDSETGMVLKGRGNKKEWDLMVKEEEKMGNIIVKGSTLKGSKEDRSEKYMPNRWYSVKKPETLSKEDIFLKYPDLFKELYE